MPAVLLPARQRVPRRARYLIPPGTARRREIVAALSLLALLAALSLAPITLGLAFTLYATGKLTRWRPAWLAVPAAAGLAWILIIGPAATLAGLAATPRAVAGVLSHRLPDPAGLASLGSLFARPASWVPGQLPAGLTLAAGVAAAAWWLDWLHTDEWRLPAPRPGLVVTGRRWLTAAFIRSGGVLTRTGVSVGVVPGTGRPAVIGWQDAGHGVLVTGDAPAALAGPAGQLAHAAIRLRKPVIVVDLAGDPGLPALLAAMCAAAGAPLLSFTAAGPGCYEPFRADDPARNAALAFGMVDWAALPAAAQQPGQSALADVFTVAGVAPADDGRAVLDDVVALLRPGALQARMDRVPSYWPGRAGLASRVAASAARLDADPDTAVAVAGQLASLRASALGRWLRGTPTVVGNRVSPPTVGRQFSPPTVSQRVSLPPVSQRVSLPRVIQQRGVVLFSLDRASNGPAADIIANLVARDIAGSFAGLRHAGTGGDGLAWFRQCETADPQALAALLAAGTSAGLATVLSTASAAAAGRLADQAGVLVIHRLADRTLASQLAGLTGQRLVPTGPGLAGRMTTRPLGAGPPLAGPLRAPGLAAPPGADWAPVVTGEAMCALPSGEFVLIRRGTRAAEVTRAVSVPNRIPVGRRLAAAGQLAGQPGRAGPPAGHSRPARPPGGASGDGQAQPPSRAAPPGPAAAPRAATPRAAAGPVATPPAAPGVLPWPNAPAWASGQLHQDPPR
jgi:hypothetical protein